VSVTAIGDDSQSIYGWRGSHPTFLMNFDRYFPVIQRDQAGKVVLEENFRSRQPIIDAAEAVLTPILNTRKVVKHGKSTSVQIEENLPHPVQLIDAPLGWNATSSEGGIWQTFSLYVATLVRDLRTSGHLARLRKGRERQPLVLSILARTNATLEAIPFRGEQLRSMVLSVFRQQGITGIETSCPEYSVLLSFLAFSCRFSQPIGEDSRKGVINSQMFFRLFSASQKQTRTLA
jgi:hypothetical protein